MKLKMNLIRELLRALDARDINDRDQAAPKIREYSDETHNDHYMMLYNKGFIRARQVRAGFPWTVPLRQKGLTLEGENFLRFLEDPNNWSILKDVSDFNYVQKIWDGSK